MSLSRQLREKNSLFKIYFVLVDTARLRISLPQIFFESLFFLRQLQILKMHSFFNGMP